MVKFENTVEPKELSLEYKLDRSLVIINQEK